MKPKNATVITMIMTTANEIPLFPVIGFVSGGISSVASSGSTSKFIWTLYGPNVAFGSIGPPGYARSEKIPVVRSGPSSLVIASYSYSQYRFRLIFGYFRLALFAFD
ncbi:MAG: hypothetical protein EZS28_039050 [Streblomastix strix]|uniref:Uncharacterized protein n=1 Tax=Streblomastix strix TaxID=222440 RepID=A0A5J4U591_9EUKA|nr:MAG: hypothetical protein EZS28_039050 [Streblomastix strix]